MIWTLPEGRLQQRKLIGGQKTGNDGIAHVAIDEQLSSVA